MPHLLDGRSLAILRIIPDVRDTFADRVWESGPAALQRIPLETRQEGVSVCCYESPSKAPKSSVSTIQSLYSPLRC